MDKKFWIEKWQSNEIGFHQEQINTYLETWWDRLNSETDSNENRNVFVPMCGKSHDMIWLLGQGCHVIGVEFSQLAVEAFFTENNLKPEINIDRQFIRYDIDNLTIFCGNFFSLSIDDLKEVNTVYDRASLIALPPEMRQQYVAHLMDVLAPNTEILLVTMEYPLEEMDGPPFSVTEQEINNLYTSLYGVIHLLSEHDVLGENSRFREKGLSNMIEKVFHFNLRVG